MAQADSRQPVTAKAWVRAWVGPRGICGGQSGTGADFSQSPLVVPCQYHSAVGLHTHTSSGGRTTGRLVAGVHTHSLTPSTLTTEILLFNVTSTGYI
jgi:hypothetical protein